MFETKKELKTKIVNLENELEFYKIRENEYKEEVEGLKAELEAIKNGDCSPDAYCEHCVYSGKVEHRHLWSTSYDYVCLKNVVCKHFDKRVAPAPQEGADNHD